MTKHYNTLLAEFLDMLTTDSEGNIKEDVNSFKFHNDWNWLMEVVYKIDKTELAGLTFAVDILNGLTQITCYGECKINGVVLPSNTTLLMAESKSRIESTYSACVQFVKWYNENKSK